MNIFLNAAQAKLDADIRMAGRIATIARKIDDEYVHLCIRVDQSDALAARRATLARRMRKVMSDHPIALRGC